MVKALLKLAGLVVLALGLGMGEAWLGVLLDGTGGAGRQALVGAEPGFALDSAGSDDPLWQDEWQEGELADWSRVPGAAPGALAALPDGVDAGAIYPEEPQLRISGAAHSAMINALDRDKHGRFLVTASDDKTVRVWSLKTGRLLKVLRPPLGAGNIGKVYAVAISPDGARVAVGGWMSWINGSHYADRIHIFDRQTGRLLRSLEGLPGVTKSLRYSADGRWLTAGLGRNGIRVWQTQSWAMQADTAYGGDVYGLAFGEDGRLATTSYDGKLRLYGPGRYDSPLKSKAVLPGKRPDTIAFNPKGRRLAVGYEDVARVSLHDGHDLASLPPPPGMEGWRGGLRVTWSGDGQTLFAGGVYDRGGTSPIVAWADKGAAEPVFLPASPNTVTGLRAFGPDGVVFGSADPVIGAFTPEGKDDGPGGFASGFKSIWRVEPDKFDVRGYPPPDLRLSYDGAKAALKPDFLWMQFDLDMRQFSWPNEDPGQLAGPRIKAPGLAITGWKSTRAPALNGAPIKLEQLEMSRSLAIAPDGQRFVLGADWSLRAYDRAGVLKWQNPVPGVAWQVNISGDGKLVVAAFDDGTIRWFRLDNGKELLALYVSTKDGNPWVAWTPKGYYDASPGGEDLIGWHVNQGPDKEALFAPAGTYRELFYQPNIIAAVLRDRDEDKAIAAIGAAADPKAALRDKQKPVVELLSPQEGETVSGMVSVRYRLQSPSGRPVTELQIQANGNTLLTLRNAEFLTLGKIHLISLQVPDGTQDLTVLAATADGYGVEQSRSLVPAVAKAPPPKGGTGTLYALVIGVSDYEDAAITDLRWAHQDAIDVTKALEAQQGGLYEKVVVKRLINEEATRANILEELATLKKAAGADDSTLLYIAGHGQNEETGGDVPSGDFYLLPHDVDTKRLASTAVTELSILNFIRNANGKKMIFVDACNSGKVDMNGLIASLGAKQNSAFVFASSQGTQASLEHKDWKNGAFTEAFLEALAGHGDYDKDGFIDHDELELYLKKTVKKLTNGQQRPATGATGILDSINLAAVRTPSGLIGWLGQRAQVLSGLWSGFWNSQSEET